MACLGVAGTSTGTMSNRVIERVKLSTQFTIPVKSPPSQAMTSKSIRCSSLEKKVKEDRATIVKEHEKFDRWMKESIETIVKNLQEAPLFVHVYGGVDEPNTKLKTEKAIREEWVELKGKWVKGEEEVPDGVILVEEIKEEGIMGMYEECEGQNGNNNDNNNTKAWGVLIQGKGENGKEIGCYLLKTSRVKCCNLGLVSTHYCLVKVTSFRESATSQLTNCWLA